LVALGIIYGDIGTSPLYVFKAIIADKVISKELIYGGLSCIFWTLTLQTTIKYVIIVLRADNNGEGVDFFTVCFDPQAKTTPDYLGNYWWLCIAGRWYDHTAYFGFISGGRFAYS
jgi:K+ transporter